MLPKNELWEKLSIIKIHINKKYYEAFNTLNTKNECNNNRRFTKYNTTLMKHFYINRGIKLFNMSPNNIKTIIINKVVKFRLTKRYT